MRARRHASRLGDGCGVVESSGATIQSKRLDVNGLLRASPQAGGKIAFGAWRAARACRARRFLVHKANTQAKSRASTKAVRGSLPRARPPGVRQKGFQQVMSSVPTNIESVLHEERVFPPPAEFSERALVKSMEELEALRREAHDSPRVLGASGRERASVVQKVGRRFEVGAAARGVVRGRAN